MVGIVGGTALSDLLALGARRGELAHTVAFVCELATIYCRPGIVSSTAKDRTTFG